MTYTMPAWIGLLGAAVLVIYGAYLVALTRDHEQLRNRLDQHHPEPEPERGRHRTKETQ